MAARGHQGTTRFPDGGLRARRLRPSMAIGAAIAWVLVTLAGCSRTPAAATVQAAATQLPPASSQGVAIYLLAQEVSPQQLAVSSHLELQEPPLLSDDDIVSYKAATHEIELTDRGYDKVHGLAVPVQGRAFAVCVDGRPVYAGAFWVDLSSQSFDGVVIDPLRATEEDPVIQIELGYPGPDYFHGQDPRADPRILQALEEAGKLR